MAGCCLLFIQNLPSTYFSNVLKRFYDLNLISTSGYFMMMDTIMKASKNFISDLAFQWLMIYFCLVLFFNEEYVADHFILVFKAAVRPFLLRWKLPNSDNKYKLRWPKIENFNLKNFNWREVGCFWKSSLKPLLQSTFFPGDWR